MIDLKNRYGFTRTPLGKDLAPSMLHRYPAHSKAVAASPGRPRERALGVTAGEVGSGKTAAARAAVTALDRPATPSFTCRTPRRAREGSTATS